MFLYKKLGKLTLIGNTQKIKEDIINLGLYWDDNRAKIIYPKNYSSYEEFVDTLFFLRKDKGIKFNEAKILVIPTNEELEIAKEIFKILKN
jgi:phosphate acetyltransferase